MTKTLNLNVRNGTDVAAQIEVESKTSKNNGQSTSSSKMAVGVQPNGTSQMSMQLDDSCEGPTMMVTITRENAPKMSRHYVLPTDRRDLYATVRLDDNGNVYVKFNDTNYD